MAQKALSLTDGHWNDLEEWLTQALSRQRRFEILRFPNETLLESYIAMLDERTDEDVRALLRRLLPRNMNITMQKRLNLLQYKLIREEHPEMLPDITSSEYWRRVLDLDGYEETSWQGITWVLDLLPSHPGLALQALSAYFTAHSGHLTDDLIWAIGDAEDIIRARWISNPKTSSEQLEILFTLNPRDFEHLIEALYQEMGYATELTPRTKDGGRDIVATRLATGQSERVLVEAKLYSRTVGVAYARALMGVVSDEKANKGVLVTTSKFSSETLKLSKRNPRLELIAGQDLVQLLNKYLGTTWSMRISHIVNARRRVTN